MSILLKKRLVFLGLLILLVIIIAVVVLKSHSSFLYSVKDKDVTFKIIGNKIEEFKVINGSERKLWESESDIDKIDTAFIADTDGDGVNELVALIWTHQDYFAERDYLHPIRGNLPSQHIRVYSINPYMNIKWGGSTMRQPLVDFGLCGETVKFLCGYQSTYEIFPKKENRVSLTFREWSFAIDDYPDYSKYKQIFISGETMLGRSVEKSMKNIEDKSYIFGGFKKIMEQSDITALPLENTFVKNPLDCGPECFILQANSNLLKILKTSGVDIAFTASNHQGDANQDGYITTKNELSQNEILNTGINNSNTLDIVIKKLDELNIGFLSTDDVKPQYWYQSGNNYGVQTFSKIINGKKEIDEDKINQISKNKKDKKINFLITHLSWGNEYQTEPDNYQKELAHKLIDAGVDLIVGTHPHVVQNFELYKGKYIFYSLGNFIFDQDFEENTREGTALTLYINTKSEDLRYLADIKIYNYKSCGPHQSSLNLNSQFSNGKISLETLTKDFETACVYYMPIEIQ